MTEPAKKEPRISVYYDGSCPMCTALIQSVSNSSKKEEFIPIDIKTAVLPEGFSKDKVEKEIHVVDSDGTLYTNANAILKIMEEYPKLRPLVKFGKLPIIRNTLPIGYAFVAANRHFLIGETSRIFSMKIAVVIGFLASLLLSIPLWIHDRTFPRVPVFNDFVLPPQIETVLFISLISLLCVIFVSNKPQKVIFATTAVVAVLILLDQMRLQPWVYFYTFILLTLGLFSWNYKDIINREKLINILRLIVASTYFFSGLQKLNVVFIGGVFPWMAEPLISLFPSNLQTLPLSLGVFIPFIEMGVGIALLSKRGRNLGIALAIMMLGFVLFTLGPLGHNWNNVVWPWNIAIALFVIILFWRAKEFKVKDIFWIKSLWYQKIILLLFVIMPFFSFFKLWDSYPSWSLYSGNTSYAEISIPYSAKNYLSIEAQNNTVKKENGYYDLNILNWSFDELNVPIYPEVRVYKKIGKDICTHTRNESILTVTEKPFFFNQSTPVSYSCSEL